MNHPHATDRPATEAEALAQQRRLAPLVREEALSTAEVTLVAGVDVTYADAVDRLVAAAVVLRLPGLDVVERSWVSARPCFPYVPGLFAFREAPPLLDVLATLETVPDVVVCDGYGRAHPRRFGLASHLGVLLDRPVVGVAKSPFVGEAVPPTSERGSWSDLTIDGEVVGRALRTRDGVKPVYVSVGHRVDLPSGTDLVLRLSPRYRVPEPIRHADRLSRAVLRDGHLSTVYGSG
ncbi:endonuclease V [Spiractinospora alimapuensis]|uniref:endonuclease V n=1 Tax=Spiractinospora alimapuensis TaxID=2820884 RepID=UPI001F41A2DA|nr:endonuclease V [Spiractinospora alimapuensis]QVQ52641.1 endonuclease V [Spiractinospora alimapuensis]